MKFPTLESAAWFAIQSQEAKDWIDSRPEKVREMILTYRPDRLYKMKSTGQTVFIYSMEEQDDGTCNSCSVMVTRRFNPVLYFERRVFGVKLADLEDFGVYVPEEESYRPGGDA